VALLVKLRQHLVQQKKLARRLHHQSYSLLSGLCLGLVAFKQVRVVAALVVSSVVEEEEEEEVNKGLLKCRCYIDARSVVLFGAVIRR
jgi:nitrite reductase/ring-hydroxylating ferredoxin subunit